MAPQRKTGINTVSRKRPDGTREHRYYDRRTGRFLGNDRDAAIALAMAGDDSAAPPPLSIFAGLCASYYKSSRFRALAPKTQKLNRFYIDRLRESFGPLSVANITRPVVVRLREAEAGRPWYASHLLAKLRLVLQHGVDVGVLKNNPALRPGGVKAPRRHQVWDQASIDKMLDATSADIRLTVALLFYTAQRPSDVLAMTWGQVVERGDRLWLSLRQQKTNELVEIPAHRRLAEMMRGTPRRSMLLVPSPRGLPWAYRNFCRAWDAVRVAAGIEGVQRRDLRRTAMVRMAEGGATTAQIAAVSGHTIDQTSRILDTYVPRRGEVAAGAIDAWERSPGSRVVILRDVQQHAQNNVQNRKSKKRRTP